MKCQLNLKWLTGVVKSFYVHSLDTFQTILERELIISEGMITRLFYQGKEVPLNITVGCLGITSKSVIIVYQKFVCSVKKESHSAPHSVVRFSKDPKHNTQVKRQILNDICNKSIDHLYSMLELQTKKNILFTEGYSRHLNMQNQIDPDELTINLDYESKISTEPLPMPCNHCTCNCNSVHIDDSDLLETTLHVAKKSENSNV
ncbi:hypothetical protein TVAG_125120 [Trichomonas vaginalis G3]|uniref:Ubiquitin-like domain-containing protein n=1 Tax=Trichomonas vaginalis (strain ATCC PRA-98 / G3) TaxID=412133 RepID=A2EIL8_TRIV3|nr:hypothetical protein TVAGG3_0199550 [Trichomonas vaginalis G3]EAY07539.1 hypothetical protein TVAG_125120 [Trichomonas vaginalis G3]KAI5550508.1 hypothetical protein TVAGG3_0199550 [Trichomonas vaginalis G3]|eukprot:XP_001319762.1 hypothetical protein [Trichomonas vaginalis G3]